MTTCRYCREPVAESDAACPHCDERLAPPAWTGPLRIGLIGVALGLFAAGVAARFLTDDLAPEETVALFVQWTTAGCFTLLLALAVAPGRG